MEPYVAFIYPPEKGSSWGVLFPDLPGCVSVGDTFEEAVINAHEAVSGHLAAMVADGDAVPAPRTYQEIVGDPNVAAEAHGAVVHLVFPRIVAPERVRVNITIDRGLLRRADEAAEAKGMTRSGFIEFLAKRHLSEVA